MRYESLDGAPRWPPALTGPYWELDGPAHRRNFTVANLAKLDVLGDIKDAVQGAIDTGQTERWFRQQLEGTLRQKGWWGPQVQVDPDTMEARIVQAGSLRRLQTIYRTNLQSAYMAGRHAQAMEQADRAPFAQYLAVRDSRTRPSHGALHGKVFRLDSPEWSVISPPNGYNCRCRARYLSSRELDQRDLKPETDVRILQRTPEKPPADRLTGESPARIIERGVSVPSRARSGERDVLWADRGWDHLPGSDGAERGLVTKALARARPIGDGVREAVVASLFEVGALRMPLQVDDLPSSTWGDGAVCPLAIKDVSDHAAHGCPGPSPSPRAFAKSRLFPEGKDDAWYVERFLAEFGADPGRPEVFEDVTGEPLLIGADLFLAREKTAKAGAPIYKVLKNGREVYLPMLADTIKDPQEIWERVEWHAAAGKTILRRRYLAWWDIEGEDQPGLAVFEWASLWWGGVTTFPPEFDVPADLDAYIAAQRQGIRRWQK